MHKSTTKAPPATTLDWDTLRFVLAVAEGGSLNAGAAALGLRHSTVLRRLDALERQMGTRLFDRHRRGYQPTEAGALMAEQAGLMRPAIADLQCRIAGRDVQLSGRVRLNTAFIAMRYLLPTTLAAFALAHPAIEVEVAEASALVDLSQRDADVALRLSQQVPGHLVGRVLGQVDFCAYALRGAAGLPQAVQALAPLCTQARWIGFERGRNSRFFERWMATEVPDSQTVLRLDQFHAMVALLHTGIGIGLLPTFAGRREPALVPVSDTIDALRTPLWLLTHPDLRGTERVRRFTQHLADGLTAALAATP